MFVDKSVFIQLVLAYLMFCSSWRFLGLNTQVLISALLLYSIPILMMNVRKKILSDLLFKKNLLFIGYIILVLIYFTFPFFVYAIASVSLKNTFYYCSPFVALYVYTVYFQQEFKLKERTRQRIEKLFVIYLVYGVFEAMFQYNPLVHVLYMLTGICEDPEIMWNHIRYSDLFFRSASFSFGFTAHSYISGLLSMYYYYEIRKKYTRVKLFALVIGVINLLASVGLSAIVSFILLLFWELVLEFILLLKNRKMKVQYIKLMMCLGVLVIVISAYIVVSSENVSELIFYIAVKKTMTFYIHYNDFFDGVKFYISTYCIGTGLGTSGQIFRHENISEEMLGHYGYFVTENEYVDYFMNTGFLGWYMCIVIVNWFYKKRRYLFLFSYRYCLSVVIFIMLNGLVHPIISYIPFMPIAVITVCMAKDDVDLY